MTAEGGGVIGEGDVGVDAATEHGAGDGDDVESAVALDERVLGREVGAADDVEVIAADGPGAGDEDAVLDAVLDDGAPEGVQEILAGIDADHDHARDGGFMGLHGCAPDGEAGRPDASIRNLACLGTLRRIAAGRTWPKITCWFAPEEHFGGW